MRDKDDFSCRELIDSCIKNDPSAWSKFIDIYSGLIRDSATNRLHKYGLHLPLQDLEDIRQAVLASLWKEEWLKTVKNRDNISYWLSIVSGNIALGYMRKRRKDPLALQVPYSQENEEVDKSVSFASSQPSPSEEVSRNEFLGTLESKIRRLPAKEKLAIKLFLFYNKTYSEISEILNMPHGTVSSYIKRAKDKLKNELKDF